MKMEIIFLMGLMSVLLATAVFTQREIPPEKLEFEFVDENTSFELYKLVDGEKERVEVKETFTDSKAFGFVVDKIVGENKKLYYDLTSNERYFNNRNNPFILERNLPGVTIRENQIGQLVEFQNKRFINFEPIFEKDINLYNFSFNSTTNITTRTKRNIDSDFIERSHLITIDTQVNTTYKINFTNKTTGIITEIDIINITNGTKIVNISDGWLIEFNNIFDLDPEFVDDTDSNFDAGTFVNTRVFGTGGAANLTSSGDNISGSYGSQIFDSNNEKANWTNITIITEAPYGAEIGRAPGDVNDASDESNFINTSGLMLLYHFNNESDFGENNTHVFDFSGSGNNGTVEGGNFTTTDSILGERSMQFHNKSSSSVAFDLNPQPDLTLSMWFKTPLPDGGANDEFYLVFNSNAGYVLRISANGDLTFTDFDSANLDADVGGYDNIWHQVIITIEDNSTTMYFDSLIVGTSTHNRQDDIGTSGDIGSRQGTVDNFHGLIDEVAIWNRSLSSEEARNLYLRGVARLNLSYRTCDDAVCDGESYTEYHNQSIFGGKVALNGSATNRYFQYNLTYSSNATDKTKDKLIVNNMSIEYRGAPSLIYWNNSVNSRFDNASSWNLGRVPIAGDDVLFNGTATTNANITNNTMPQNLSSFSVDSGYTGTITFWKLFAEGDYSSAESAESFSGNQEWNVSGNINITDGTMDIYGDYPFNLTANGHGQIWRSLNGNISIGSSATLDGIALGFGKGVGPGTHTSTSGGSHGARGQTNSGKNPYGNASAPTSLGSGGFSTVGGGSRNERGGSAIKLEADILTIDGTINMQGSNAGGVQSVGAGGSIWLKANNITGNGDLFADGGTGSKDGGGGRIRLEYSSGLSYTGDISLDSPSQDIHGTLTFTNNTWQGDWNLTGNIGLLGGDYGEGEIINVLGNFNTKGFDVTIYGDCFYDATNPVLCYNTTLDGKGVWINASGAINISKDSLLHGLELGFPQAVGPGKGSSISIGASHGGKGGGSSAATYGNQSEPTSLGSGGATTGSHGGSAIKLESSSDIFVEGKIDVRGLGTANGAGSSGGSIWLSGGNVTLDGVLNATVPDSSGSNRAAGGGGRIALTSSDLVVINGVIEVIGAIGGSAASSNSSGGTVYINATNSITIAGNITVFAGAGATGGLINITNTLLDLSGIFNASVDDNEGTGTEDVGNITITYTDCDSTFDGQFDPDRFEITACTGAADTCSPDSPLTADHLFEATDNCVLSSVLDAAENDITCALGTGTFGIVTSGRIDNVNIFAAHANCDFTCRNTAGCFG